MSSGRRVNLSFCEDRVGLLALEMTDGAKEKVRLLLLVAKCSVGAGKEEEISSFGAGEGSRTPDAAWHLSVEGVHVLKTVIALAGALVKGGDVDLLLSAETSGRVTGLNLSAEAEAR